MRTEISFFNDTSASYRAEYEKMTPEGYSFRVRREKVLELLPAGNGKHILDLASGPGVMIKGLRAKGYRVTCVDAAPDMVALAKEEAGDDSNVVCEVGDAYSLKYQDGSFDALTAMGLIEYLEDENRFLGEMRRVLTNAGIAVITVPNVWSPWRIWNRMLRALVRVFKPGKKVPLLHREYTLKRVRALLAQHHFKTEAVSYYNFKPVLYPLDRFFPRATVVLSGLFEHLDKTPLRFVGTGFIVKARKELY